MVESNACSAHLRSAPTLLSFQYSRCWTPSRAENKRTRRGTKSRVAAHDVRPISCPGRKQVIIWLGELQAGQDLGVQSRETRLAEGSKRADGERRPAQTAGSDRASSEDPGVT
jgi:hypothetical protein